jgi:hypothetical protein
MPTRARLRSAHSRGIRVGIVAGFAALFALGGALALTDPGSGGGATVSASSPCVGAPAPSGGFHHVVEVWFENTSAGSGGTVSGAPFVNSLVTGCGHASRWTDANYRVDGTTKDGSYNSRPSYVTAATGVSPTVHGVTDDSYTAKTSKPNVWAQAMNAGRSANAYMEGRASGDVCSGGGATSGSYHDSLRAVSPTLTNAWCNAHDLDLSQFDPAHLPAYSAVYPKNTSNWHDNSISSGDTWLKDHLSPLLNSPAYAAGDVAVVFHTDEDTPVVNAVIAPSVKPGAVIPAASHFSITRLIDDVMGQPELGDSPRAPSLLGLLGGGVVSTTTSSTTGSSTSSSTATSSSTSSSTTTTSTSTTTRPQGGCVDHTGTLDLTSSQYLHVVTSGCWQGGIAWDTDPADAPWSTFHHSAAWLVKGPGVTIRDTIAVQFGDSYQIASTNAAGWMLDNVQGHVGRDDAIENDRHQSGTAKGSTFSSFVLYSDSGGNTTDGSSRTVVLNGNDFHLDAIPSQYKPDNYASHVGTLFKIDKYAARLWLVGNRFVMEDLTPSYGSLGPPPASKIAHCSGNVIVWSGTPGGYPASAKAAWLSECSDTKFLGA